jgi:hypothetical protein
MVEQIKQSCIRHLNIMKILSKLTWGTNTGFMLEFYSKYIRAKIDYAWIFYNIASKSILNKLEVIQNSTLRIALSSLLPFLASKRRIVFVFFFNKCISHISHSLWGKKYNTCLLLINWKYNSWSENLMRATLVEVLQKDMASPIIPPMQSSNY